MDTLMRDRNLEALAEEVARLEGTSVAEAVRRALERQKARLEEIAAKERRLDEVLAEVRRAPDRDLRDPDTILYDEFGAPR